MSPHKSNLHHNRALALACAALALGAALGCEGDLLTAEERATLEGLRLAPLAPSPTNAVADNADAAQLGHKFFFDRRFSGPLLEGSDPAMGGIGAKGASGMVACATCHDPVQGGADPRSQSGVSLAAGWTGRNSPTVINAAHGRWQFWDGRKDTLWSQALGPIESPVEQNTTRVHVARVIHKYYRPAYEALFGTMPDLNATRFPEEGRPGMAGFDAMSLEDKVAVNRVFANFGKAIEAYERLLIDKSSPFDRFMAGDQLAMSPAAIRGAKLFVGRAACNECHNGPMMADNKFHNHGVPQIGAKVPSVDMGRAEGINKLLSDEFNSAGDYVDAARSGLLEGLRVADRDVGAFKTPTLRNVNKTAPYMHTGGFDSLWDVVLFYNDAAGTDGFSGTRAPASQVALRLSNEDIADLVEFLRALDGDPLGAVAKAPELPPELP
jgi:cytochrome c peroxidase